MTDTKVKPALPTLNVDLLGELITWAWADDNKKNEFMAKYFPDWGDWNQGEWAQSVRNGVCKTAYCMAGQAVVQANYAIKFEYEPEEVYNGIDGWVKTGRMEASASTCYPVRKNGKDAKGNQKYKRNGDDVSIEITAREILGFTYAEAEEFFAGENDLVRLVNLALNFAEARGVRNTLILSDDIMALEDDNFFCHIWDYGDYSNLNDYAREHVDA